MTTTNTPAPLAHRIPEACARIGVGRAKLYELIAAGEVRMIKIGSRSLVLEEDLQRLIATRLSDVAAAGAHLAGA